MSGPCGLDTGMQSMQAAAQYGHFCRACQKHDVNVHDLRERYLCEIIPGPVPGPVQKCKKLVLSNR